MPKHTPSSSSPKKKKISDIFRPSKESNRSSRPKSYDFQDLSPEALKLWEKNELIISQECDRNNNNKGKVTADTKRPSGSSPVQPSAAEVADEMLLQIQDIMKRVISVATTDPGLLNICWEVMEIQSRRDDFIARLVSNNEFTPVIERPLRWDLKCVQELNNFPSTRMPSLEKFTEETMALLLQQTIKTVSRDLGVIKNFVKVHERNDDYLFRRLTGAYKNHLYKLMESLTATEMEDKQLHSILLFIGDFRQKFPRSEFADFWDEDDGHHDLSIISPEKYQDLTNGYLERQSAVIKMQMSRGLDIEYKHWLKGADNEHGSKLSTTQWPADVTDLCDQNLQVSLQIAPAVYHRMHTSLQMELAHAVKLYGAGAKYFIHPCKLTYGSRCPVLLSMTKCRDKMHQDPVLRSMRKTRDTTFHDPPSDADRQTMHAILNSFALLHKHLATLSEKFPATESGEQFLSLQSLVRAQSLECFNHYKKHVFRRTMKKYERLLLSEEWFPVPSIRDQLCDDVVSFTRALDRQYFDTWFEEVRLGVHHVYLKAICKTCKQIRCENAEQRTQVAGRLILEEQTIQEKIREYFPDYQDDYIKLLQQIADIIVSTDQESCQTSIAIVKHKQRDIISKTHLKAILTVHGKFSSRHRRIIGTLYKSNT